MAGQRDQGESARLVLSRGTEQAAERRVKRFKALEWRRERWGRVLLTEREYEAVCLEHEVLQLRDVAAQFRRVDTLAKEEHDKRLAEARAVLSFQDYVMRYQRGDFDVLDDAYRDSLLAQAHRGVQVQIAQRMKISKQRVSVLLHNASKVMTWMADFTDDYVGWAQDKKGRWELIAPAATVERAKIITVDFTPWQSEKRRAA